MKRNTPKGSVPAKMVFLFDVDNTLLDNDRVIADLSKFLKREVGPERARYYWTIFERLRTRLGYAVDDKLRILAAIKKFWRTRVTTVFVRQGHNALDPKILAAYPAADLSIERIGGLLNCGLQDFAPRAAQVARRSV